MTVRKYVMTRYFTWTLVACGMGIILLMRLLTRRIALTWGVFQKRKSEISLNGSSVSYTRIKNSCRCLRKWWCGIWWYKNEKNQCFDWYWYCNPVSQQNTIRVRFCLINFLFNWESESSAREADTVDRTALDSGADGNNSALKAMWGAIQQGLPVDSVDGSLFTLRKL